MTAAAVFRFMAAKHPAGGTVRQLFEPFRNQNGSVYYMGVY